MFVNSDFSDLLQIFNANHVKYLVIGGYAVVEYTEPRFTKDLDIWISAEAINAEIVYKSLKEFGAPLENMSAADFSEEGYFFQMGVPPVRIDLLMGVPGAQFDECWERRNVIQFDDLPISFISREDLIITKMASGRPQDLIDAESLQKSTKRKKTAKQSH